METGFAVTGFVNLILNLLLPEELEDEEIPELTANHADDEADKEEWERVKGAKDGERASGSVDAPATKEV
jgi:uric acid-xanthine permease